MPKQDGPVRGYQTGSAQGYVPDGGPVVTPSRVLVVWADEVLGYDLRERPRWTSRPAGAAVKGRVGQAPLRNPRGGTRSRLCRVVGTDRRSPSREALRVKGSS